VDGGEVSGSKGRGGRRGGDGKDNMKAAYKVSEQVEGLCDEAETSSSSEEEVVCLTPAGASTDRALPSAATGNDSGVDQPSPQLVPVAPCDRRNAGRSTNDEEARKGEIGVEEEGEGGADPPVPPFLRCYTAASVYVRVVAQGVEILERERRYVDAVALLRWLLSQRRAPTSRGRWWGRLALNLSHHLHDPLAAVEACRFGLQDPHVRTGHRLELIRRAHRLCAGKGASMELLQCRQFFPETGIAEPEHIVIRGKCLTDHEQPGRNLTFIDGRARGGDEWQGAGAGMAEGRCGYVDG